MMEEEAAEKGRAVIFRDIRRYYCDYCGICRSKKSLITSHVLTHHKVRLCNLSFCFCFSSSWLIVAAFTGRTFFYIYRNQDCAFLFIKEKRSGFDLLLIFLILLIIFVGFGFFS